MKKLLSIAILTFASGALVMAPVYAADAKQKSATASKTLKKGAKGHTTPSDKQKAAMAAKKATDQKKADAYAAKKKADAYAAKKAEKKTGAKTKPTAGKPATKPIKKGGKTLKKATKS